MNFFCIPFHPNSWPLSVFEWTDLDTHVTGQYTWTVLPQGFRDSPHNFGQVLGKKLPHGTIIQYADNILTCSPTKQDSDHNTILISWGKRDTECLSIRRRFLPSTVKYLGYHLTQGSCSLSIERKEATLNLAVP